MKNIILIGAGGHAKVVMDALMLWGLVVAAYVDPKAAAWLEAQGVVRLLEKNLDLEDAQLVMGFLGLDCAALKRRHEMMRAYRRKGAAFPPVVHPSASVSAFATLGAGAQIFPGAVVNAGAVIGECAVINSGAVVEHDAVIGAGAHMAPRSVALGGVRVGECAYIGSGATIIQNAKVPAKKLIKALSVYKAAT